MARYNGLGDRENDNPLPGERAFSNYSVLIFFQSGTSQMLMGLCGCYDCIWLSGGFREEIETPFSRGTVEDALVIQQRF